MQLIRVHAQVNASFPSPLLFLNVENDRVERRVIVNLNLTAHCQALRPKLAALVLHRFQTRELAAQRIERLAMHRVPAHHVQLAPDGHRSVTVPQFIHFRHPRPAAAVSAVSLDRLQHAHGVPAPEPAQDDDPAFESRAGAPVPQLCHRRRAFKRAGGGVERKTPPAVAPEHPQLTREAASAEVPEAVGVVGLFLPAPRQSRVAFYRGLAHKVNGAV